MIGDWDAKVGNKTESSIIGKFVLEVTKEAGDRFMDFCEANNLFITNTCFKQPHRRRCTWTSPDGRSGSQIDCVIACRTWRSCVLSARTRPGTDRGADHGLLTSNVKVQPRKSSERIAVAK